MVLVRVIRVLNVRPPKILRPRHRAHRPRQLQMVRVRVRGQKNVMVIILVVLRVRMGPANVQDVLRTVVRVMCRRIPRRAIVVILR